VFDVTSPRQYIGAAAYRKDWQEFLDSFNGPITANVTELDIVADQISPTATTAVIGWVVHEHNSFPVDLDTGRADLNSKP
jgi:hypothetical protein